MNGYYQRNFYSSHDRRHPHRIFYGQTYQHPQAFGTLTPILRPQRAYHDAIYEEEYGSDQDDDCCQSRGMSAIFCWFLSVIILIGLAASVVLTVFFILKSKSSSNAGELDLLFDGEHGISFHFPESTTELNNFGLSSSSNSKEYQPSSSTSFEHFSNDETDRAVWNKKESKTNYASTTKFPPSRKGPSQIFSEENTFELPPGLDFASSRETQRTRPFGNGVPREEAEKSLATNDKKSEGDPSEGISRNSEPVIDTTPHTPSQVLFTSPPASDINNGNNRRNLQTTRFPTGRTSFTTSTETLVDHDEDDGQHDKNNSDEDNESEQETESVENHLAKNGEDNFDVEYEEDSEENVAESNHFPSKLDTKSESHSKEVDKTQIEESQLHEMLLDEIPPHPSDAKTKHSSENVKITTTTPLSTTFNLPTREKTAEDPLARIIKNLNPKWGRNRTIETTTMTSGNFKYDFTISSREKNQESSVDRYGNIDKSSKETNRDESSTTSSNFVTHSPAYNSIPKSNDLDGTVQNGPGVVLNSVESPNLTRRYDDTKKTQDKDNNFMDVLVGSEDHKTLVTKETKDGIFTSAILPPWYDVQEKNESSETSSATLESNEIQDLSDDKNVTTVGGGSAESASDEVPSASSVFGGILDFFKNLPINNRNQKRPPGPPPPPPPRRRGPPGIVPKRPQGAVNIQDNAKGETHPATVANDKSELLAVLPSTLGPSTVSPTSNEATVTDDIMEATKGFHFGTSESGVNIYGYYPDEDVESEQTVVTHDIQSDKLSPDILDKIDAGSEPSHSIELQIAPGLSSDVVLEDDDPVEEYSYARYGEAHSGSQLVQQFVDPVKFHQGGGIRRPLGEKSSTAVRTSDLDMKESDNRAVFANSQASQNQRIHPGLMRRRPEHNADQATQESKHLITHKNLKKSSEELTASIKNNGNDITGDYENYDLDYQYADYPSSSTETVQNEEKGKDTVKVGDNNSKVESYEPPSYEATGEIYIDSKEVPTNQWDIPHALKSTEIGLWDTEESHKSNSSVENQTSSKKLENNKDAHQDAPDNGELTTEEKLDFSYEYNPGSLEENHSEGTLLEHDLSSSSTTTIPQGVSTEYSVEGENSSKRFNPPTPVSFHDNKYTFSAPSSDSIYQSKNGWRPVLSDRSASYESASWQETFPELLRITTTAGPMKPNSQHETQDLTGESSRVSLEHINYSDDHETHFENDSRGPENHDTGKLRFGENQPPKLVNHEKIQRPGIEPTHVHPQPRPFHFQNAPNIDRSKYMIRPAPPPIVMRRPPIAAMPFIRNRSGHLRPQLIPQVQNPPQYATPKPTPPTEFPTLRRRFKKVRARPRGNVNWPADSDRQ